MNKVYESETMIVHDDREFITPDEAFELLYSGKSITVTDPPNYSAENEHEIFSAPFTYYLGDVLSEEMFKNILREKKADVRREVIEYLRGFELSK